MRFLRSAMAVTAAVLLCHPLAVAASEEEYVTPECQKTLYYHVGELEVHFDRNFNGANISIYRTQEEGEFPYYSYDIRLMDETLMHCDLIEGDYQMEITIPSSTGTEYISYPPISFTVKDPDMDEKQSFDRTDLQFYLTSDPDLIVDVLEQVPDKLEGRTIYQESTFRAAGLSFSAGDMNKDGSVNATDAALILIAAAEMGAGKDSGLTALQLVEADLTGDSIVNASDSAVVLQYAADHGTGSFTGDALAYARIRAGKQKSV